MIYSDFFAPTIGGVETVVLTLARGLANLRKPDGAREFDLISVIAETGRPIREHFAFLPNGYQLMRAPIAFSLRLLAKFPPGDTVPGDNHVLAIERA